MLVLVIVVVVVVVVELVVMATEITGCSNVSVKVVVKIVVVLANHCSSGF